MTNDPSLSDVERELEKATEKAAESSASDLSRKLKLAWRDADPENRPEGMMWEPEADDGRAHLEYDTWAAQREALTALEDTNNDLVAFLAGYGSGKSITGARWIIMQALRYPGSRFLVLGIDFAKAKDTTFRILFESLPGDRTERVTSAFNGPEQSPIVDDYNRQDYRITLTNDSVLKLGSADRWNRYAGDSYSGVWADEPSHYGSDLHDLLEMLGSRLRGVDGPKKQFWTLTGNGFNEAHEILEQRQDSNGEPLGLNIEVIRASTLDNPYLTEGDKDSFKRQYGGTSREEQALHGGFAAAQGLVYGDFRRDTHVIPHSEAVDRVEDGWRVYGYDAGWNDPRVLLEIGRTPYGQLVVLDEFYKSNTHVGDTIRWLEQNGKHQGTIFAEHEPSDIQKFKQAGFRTEKATKSLDAGISEVKRRLRDDGSGAVDDSAGAAGSPGPNIQRPRSTKVHTGSTSTSRSRSRSRSSSGSTNGMVTPDPEPVNGTDEDDAGEDDSAEQQENADAGRVGLLVSSDCEHLIQEFLSYKEEQVGSNRAVDHGLDALRYACMGVGGGSSGGGGARVFPDIGF